MRLVEQHRVGSEREVREVRLGLDEHRVGGELRLLVLRALGGELRDGRRARIDGLRELVRSRRPFRVNGGGRSTGALARSLAVVGRQLFREQQDLFLASVARAGGGTEAS